MLEEHFEIEAAARKTLSGVLSTNVLELTLQYTGYLTKLQKESAEVNKENLKKGLGSTELVPYQLPKKEDSLPSP